MASGRARRAGRCPRASDRRARGGRPAAPRGATPIARRARGPLRRGDGRRRRDRTGRISPAPRTPASWCSAASATLPVGRVARGSIINRGRPGRGRHRRPRDLDRDACSRRAAAHAAAVAPAVPPRARRHGRVAARHVGHRGAGAHADAVPIVARATGHAADPLARRRRRRGRGWGRTGGGRGRRSRFGSVTSTSPCPSTRSA